MALSAEQIWPDSFPLAKLSTYNSKRDNGFLRTEMEGGPSRQRRAFSQVSDRYNTELIFTNDEYFVFRGFFKHILNEGADIFQMKLDLDVGLTDEIVRFIGPYTSRKMSHTHWSVAGVLEVQNPTIICADLTSIIIAGGEDFVVDLETIATLLSDLEVFMATLTIGISVEDLEAIALLLTDLEILMVALT